MTNDETMSELLLLPSLVLVIAVNVSAVSSPPAYVEKSEHLELRVSFGVTLGGGGVHLRHSRGPKRKQF